MEYSRRLGASSSQSLTSNNRRNNTSDWMSFDRHKSSKMNRQQSPADQLCALRMVS